MSNRTSMELKLIFSRSRICCSSRLSMSNRTSMELKLTVRPRQATYAIVNSQCLIEPVWN